MSISIDKLITELSIHAPQGVELPRDPDTNEIYEDMIKRWAADGAQEINNRRGKTTVMEQTITLEADTYEYDLPDDCRSVVCVKRNHGSVSTTEVLGIPTSAGPFAMGAFGRLPTGQEISASLDFLNRTRLADVEDEDQHELIGGQIRFLFPVTAGDTVLVRYNALDRDYASLSSDRFTLLLTYLRVQAIDWWLGKFGASISVDGDSFGADTSPALVRLKLDLEAKWIAGLNAIGPEAN